MFTEKILTLGVEAMREIVGDGIEVLGIDDPMKIHVGVEYPLEVAHVPGIWVNFSATTEVVAAGIGHVEWVEIETGADAGKFEPVYRWRFGGVYEFTIVTLGNLERARVVDWVMKEVGMAGQDSSDAEAPFRTAIERSDLVDIQPSTGSFMLAGYAETPGTPWASDDVTYEATISLALQGSVAYNPKTRKVVPLSKVVIYPDINEPPHPEMDADGQGPWV